jgi:hypothetical protein
MEPSMTGIQGCQIPSIPRFSEGLMEMEPQPLPRRIKRRLAGVWNHLVKPAMKQGYRLYLSLTFRRGERKGAGAVASTMASRGHLESGDTVRVRSIEEVRSTLDVWKELRGCAFLESMWQYCGTTQVVMQRMERFVDERDYKVKKVNGIVLLEGAICRGTAVFGRCDRCCYLFWREEWLEKVEAAPQPSLNP